MTRNLWSHDKQSNIYASRYNRMKAESAAGKMGARKQMDKITSESKLRSSEPASWGCLALAMKLK